MSSETGSEHDEEEVRSESLLPRIDDTFLNECAKRCRLPYDRPTEHELAFFPEIWDSKSSIEVYLLIRNTTLATWLSNQWKECTAADVRQNLNPPFNSDIDFIQNIVHYLTRHGIINFGRYTRVTKIKPRLPRDDRNVIVIGAGAAGIAAATQLTSFGFNVTIIEGRNRIGGRVQNLVTRNGEVMETGGDSLRTLEESPFGTLLHQVQMEQHAVFDNSTVFFDGKPVDVQRDSMVTGMYISSKGALDWQAHNREHRDENGRFISRQQAYENVLNLVERGTQIKYFNYCKSLEEMARAREHHYEQMKILKKTALLAEKKLNELKEDEDPLLRRSLKRDIVTTMEKFDDVLHAFETADNHYKMLSAHPVSKQYMHPYDFRSLNFMFGFEEYLYGAPLEKVQFSCDANRNKKNGCVTRLADGIAHLLQQIAEKRRLDFRLNHRVRDIDYSGKEMVKLKVERENGEIIEMEAPFVVSTLPIGVLKKTIVNDPRAPTFTPALSDRKVDAIKCLGSGLINKCLLQFERAFWAPTERYQFVTISQSIRERSHQLIWSAVPGSKVIATYMVGDAAVQSVPDEMIIESAMQSLQKIFGHHCPKAPVSAHITRWQDDEFAFGSGSFMSLRTEMYHFDELAYPLFTGDKKPRVFFAGEHTCPTNTGSLQGAWMSGTRVAADLANEHIGVGFVDLENDIDYKASIANEEIIIEDVDGELPSDEDTEHHEGVNENA